jgi:hypothetical protein
MSVSTTRSFRSMTGNIGVIAGITVVSPSYAISSTTG